MAVPCLAALGVVGYVAGVKQRIFALDWMRGLVMILMAIDHAGAAFNGGRLMTDTLNLYPAGTELPAAQFFTRWITHLCAPTFLFLAGTSLALSIERRAQASQSAFSIDRHLFIRGFIIAMFDVVLISRFWFSNGILLQVLYAIGVSLWFMIPLRRLSTPWLLGTAGMIIFAIEPIASRLTMPFGGLASAPGALFIQGGLYVPWSVVTYPVLPWLAMMILGWAFGRYLLRTDQTRPFMPAKLLAIAGTCSLLLFVILRAANGYGNMLLLRDDDSWVQWLHVSKYPPSITFAALELGLMALILAGLMVLERRSTRPVSQNNPLLVFGQTALFFYILHVPILELSAYALGVHDKLGLGANYAAAASVLLVLYPLCRWYRGYKRRHPNGWPRYI